MRHDAGGSVLPMARTAGLVVEELDGEVLIYDVERHRAHCLNKASAMVWRACDGSRAVPELTALIEKSAPGWDQATTDYALTQLEKRHLLSEALRVVLVVSTHSRRAVFR
jgi:hypothetical protein